MEGEKSYNPNERVSLDASKLNQELEKVGAEESVQVNPEYQKEAQQQEVQESVEVEQTARDGVQNIGGGSPEVQAQGFQAPTAEQISEAEENKRREEMAKVPPKKPWWKIW
ncbi:MAG: hypothetical protein L3J07_01030 [Candidatus Magasanikbacteria bacterium]|nr:hypothetical protein [Candidatus Magasanikbacteria bacterium]